ncbi:twin-arginine translocase TatA/TatE family subunit [Lysinibacter sp. HNR]|uniref:twin-arginine translocase TatA/TatE family subunit n=1 Tax=Lysinibacter sp. HNR TaxID=3031408 RepID=UPI002435596A|nr:twin-arginine translocase TatA/TatE family subunit [Lysinibacter sp. HNR]WGD36220.1 twin-arginine translocase TatA/TatE family subunit [Lysinibacter sp. HNR]
MLGNAFSGWHAIIILVVIVLLFGASKLPALARSVGQSMKIFRGEMKADAGAQSAPDGSGTENNTTQNSQATTSSVSTGNSTTSSQQ